jgi:prephenate dehydrogenase
MAGSHRAGVGFASADLFEGAPYAIMDEGPASRSEALEMLAETVRLVGGHAVFLTPEDHDRVVARTSHAPQLLSIALALAVGERVAFSGRGLADMTRLAASRWQMWRDICRTNGDEIAAALSEMNDEIRWLNEAMVEKRFEDVQDAFEKANEIARSIHRDS